MNKSSFVYPFKLLLKFLGCFQVGAIMNKSPLNTPVQVFLWKNVSCLFVKKHLEEELLVNREMNWCFFFFKLYIIVLVLPNIKMNPPQVYMCSPFHPSGSSQCTSPKHPVSCIEPGLATHFIHDILHVSMPFSQIFLPSPSLTESIRLFYTSVSLLLSPTQGYCYKNKLKMD